MSLLCSKICDDTLHHSEQKPPLLRSKRLYFIWPACQLFDFTFYFPHSLCSSHASLFVVSCIQKAEVYLLCSFCLNILSPDSHLANSFTSSFLKSYLFNEADLDHTLILYPILQFPILSISLTLFHFLFFYSSSNIYLCSLLIPAPRGQGSLFC